MTTPSRFRLVRRAAAALVGGVVLSVIATACQGTALAAVTVNGHVISESALTSELQDIAANTAYVAAIQQSGSPPPSVLGKGKGTFDMAFTDKVLTRQVLLELVHEEVVSRKLVISAADVQAAATDQATAIGNDTNGKPIFPAFPKAYQDLLSRRAAEVTALQDSLAGITVDDPTIQKYYNAHTADYVLNCVSVIQLATQATADQTRAKVTAPGADYAAIARQVSTDAQSATNGGDLGCQPVGAFSQVPGVDAAVAALSVGQVSPVIPVQGTTPAFALFKLTDRKPQALTAVRTQVIAALHNSGSTQFNTFVQSDVAKARVTVNPKYGSWSPTGATAGIVPPPAPPASAGGSGTTTVPAASVPAQPPVSDTSQPPVSDTTPTVPAQATPTSAP